MSEPGIELTQVGCRVAGRWVLRDVSLRISAGEVFALVGPNGGGKSLLLAICATLVHPQTGTIRVGGRDPRSDVSAVRRLIGYVPEDIGWHPRMTVSEDLQFFAGAHGMPREARRGAVAGALGRWSLLAVADEPLGRLSRGFLRRVALARAWLHGPRILLLDEPVVGLDSESRETLWREVRRHVDEGGSALLASHEAREAARFSHRIGIVADGRLREVMEPRGLTATSPEVILGVSPAVAGPPA